jgi:hypothetical protein
VYFPKDIVRNPPLQTQWRTLLRLIPALLRLILQNTKS